jgi:anti-sigma regulatory factor (Ser/Thr protein kinase)
MVAATAVLHSRLGLGRELAAVRDARRHAREVLDEWEVPDEALDDALSIVTEMVANAVRHTGAEKTRSHGLPAHCVLELRVVAGYLYVVVHDASRWAPVVRPPSRVAENGRGLLLVSALSKGAWGFTYGAHGVGKLVWARLSLPCTAVDTGAPDCAPGTGRAELSPVGVAV